MSEKEKENGHQKMLWFVVSSLFSIVLLGGGAWLSILTSRVSEIDAMQRTRGDRIGQVEGRVDSLDKRFDRLEPRLERIEQKIDALVANKR